jgi:predicted short-subunit dehydrogenase-like oxidoreductase (DUF2520 family)
MTGEVRTVIHNAAVLKTLTLFVLQPEGKTAYHAAAVLSSNYLIALQSVAVDLLADAGIDESEGLNVLMPIIEGTVHSLKVNGVPNVCETHCEYNTLAHSLLCVCMPWPLVVQPVRQH